jgi:uncharacterized protein (TIGR03437 family)
MTFSSLRSKSPVLMFLLGACAAVPSAFSQTLTITGGQGQLLTPVQISQALTVKLVDASGTPIGGAPITYTTSDQLGKYFFGNSQTATTDSTGSASVYIFGAGLLPNDGPFDSATVTASYAGIVFATFYETTTNVANSAPLVTVSFTQNFQTLTGPAGTPSTGGVIQALANSVNGGVPNIALSVTVDPGSVGTITCAEGPFPLTNASGIATCTPVFGTLGMGTVTVRLGPQTYQVHISFNVTVGPPALIQITSGNNQSGTPGKQLSQPLVAIVTDLGGNPAPNLSMTFSASPTNGATFTNVRQVTDSAGKVSANVVLGSIPGAIQITLTDAGGLIKNPAIFTETVNVSLTGISKNSGDQQSAFINTAFSVPLTVTVASSQGALAGTPVTFAVTSGSATVATPSVSTNASGQASTAVTAGGTAGPVVITATTGQFSISFNLTVVPPGPSNLSFTNGASGALNSLSPGAIVTIYGSGLATNIQGVTSAFGVGPLPLSMAGVTVQFGQTFAPIIDIGNVSGSQFVSIEVPRELTAGATTVTISTPGGGSTIVPVTINAASPGLFTYAGAGNAPFLVAIKANGTVASPTNPANRGETIAMYVTGLPLTPGVGTNAFPAPGSTATPLYPIILGVANQGAPYTAVAYSPDLQGVETLTFTVPNSTNPGAVQISIGVQTPSGTFFSQGATLNVQ